MVNLDEMPDILYLNGYKRSNPVHTQAEAVNSSVPSTYQMNEN